MSVCVTGIKVKEKKSTGKNNKDNRRQGNEKPR